MNRNFLFLNKRLSLVKARNLIIQLKIMELIGNNPSK